MCACAHIICMPPFLPMDFKEHAHKNPRFSQSCARPIYNLFNGHPIVVKEQEMSMNLPSA